MTDIEPLLSNRGQVTESTTPEEDSQYFGQIQTTNNSSINPSNTWTILDYLGYFFNKDKENEANALESKNNIINTVDTVKDKFSFTNNIIKNAQDIKDFIINTQETHKFYIKINHEYFSNEVCIIDLSWYEPYKPTVDALICAFAYLAFIWRMFCNIPSLIGGASIGNYVQDINTYKNTGFGRSSNIHKGGF